ncbi:GAF domain-containing protein [Rheinheimera maricola]|uniref:GAF domain-containing protein n=1 Tax=Rheinheimera maricola TaxID=2793282 RepID=A0ABS7XF27_9GAMM|nr:GAF domain-containing protein [Rheinheimera maricola]MBZ9613288.1 GAF domain-containing protein [Rheinheimera maricola]
MPTSFALPLAELTARLTTGNISMHDATMSLLQSCLDVLQVQRASVWLSTDDDLLSCRMLLDKTDGMAQEPLMIDRWSFPGYFRTLDQKGIICAADAYNDAATKELYDAFLRPLEIRSLLDVPLLQDNKLIGIICCEHTKVIKHWTEEEIQFVTALSRLYQPLYASQP